MKKTLLKACYVLHIRITLRSQFEKIGLNYVSENQNKIKVLRSQSGR